jgi:outer membrane protein assembly factor BamB
MARHIGLFVFSIFLSLGIPSTSSLVLAQDDSQTESDKQAANEWTAKKLLKAAQAEDLDGVKAAIKAGVDVNSKSDYGATALFFACDRGNEEMVDALLAAEADPNVKDTFYKATPITWALQKQHKSIVAKLLGHGGEGADGFLLSAIQAGDDEFAKSILDTKAASEAGMVRARDAAVKMASKAQKHEELPALFADFDLPDAVPLEPMTPEMLKKFDGKYQGPGFSVSVEADDEELMLGFNENPKAALEHTGPNEFLLGASSVKFEMDGEAVKQLVLTMNGNNMELTPVVKSEMKEAPASKDKPKAEAKPENKEANEGDAEEADAPKYGASSAESRAADLAISSSNWAGFRGNGGRGVADGQSPPTEWNVSDDDSENVNFKWKTAIPGLGLSCPSIHGDKIYLTSAFSEKAEGDLKIGLYGNVDSVEEDYVFDFNVYCVDKQTGKLLWERKAASAKPAVKRHAKSSHANPTVATNGEQVIAFFGSEGLYCYSSDGELEWKKDLGFLDSGWFYDAGYQWGFGSSPIIFEDNVIVQCDIQGDSFVAAFNLKTGDEVWRTMREEIPSWSTPTVHQFDDVPMLLTHATKAARGYDARDGKLLWTLSNHSEIVVPTPFVAHNLIFIASGYSPIQPIYAIRPEARGDITLADNTTTNEFIPWSTKRGGPYMPSPIVYGDYLYCCSNSGILSCHDAKSGKQVYKKRMRAKGGTLSFTGSPIAADGHLYCTSEDGRVLVVKAGPEFELVSTNACGESVLTTPAISEGVIYLRTQSSLIAVGK